MISSNGDKPATQFIDQVFSAGIKLPFDAPLHNYQIEDINAGCVNTSYGDFLDLGLGKTVVGAMTAASKLLNGYDRAVVVCPASLIDQWYDVLVNMNFKVLKYAGTPTERAKAHFDYDFTIMSFEIFQKDYERLISELFPGAYFVIDEATVLSNTKNKFYKMFNGGIVEKKRKVVGMLKPMIDIVEYPNINNGCVLLTATPSDKPSDLYGLINTIDKNVYSNQFQFNRLHVAAENIFGAPREFTNLDLLKTNLNSVASIRFASDHLEGLPTEVFNVIEYDLDPDHYALYQELVENKLITFGNRIVIDAIQATSFYNWAQKIIVNPEKAMYNKEPKGLAILDTIVRNNPQTLIVNKYVMSNQKMMERYKDIGIGGCFGGIPRSKQQEYIKAFQERRLKALTVNPRSGGVGLNLQVCSHVIYPEIPVTARDFRQSKGRVVRQGQEADRVIITMLIARRTIQRSILNSIMDKDEVMNEVIPTPKTLRENLFPV